MNCLRDYIGLRWCGNTTTPPSGLYVNDLPAISLKQITSLTDEETATFSELWNIIQQRAEMRFASDLRDAMGKRYKINSINQGGNIGKGVTGSAGASLGAFSGFCIELVDTGQTDFMPSALTFITVQTLQFYASAGDAGESKQVAIWDMSTGEQLFTTTVRLATGWNTVQVNTKLTNSFNTLPKSVFCGIASSTLSVYELDVPSNSNTATCCKARIRGAYTASTSNITSDNLTFTDNTYGLSGVFSVQCGWDGMVCQNKEPFTRAYWYCLGVELLTEQIHSTKLNSYTTIGLQKARELRDEYTTEYNKSLMQVCENIELDCDCCIECAGSVQLVETPQFF